jgi:hypothetical protein
VNPYFCAVVIAALIYKLALIRRAKSPRLRRLCICCRENEVKAGRTLCGARCRKRMSRRKQRIAKGLPPEAPKKLPLFPKLGYSTQQKEMPFTGKINDWSGGYKVFEP